MKPEGWGYNFVLNPESERKMFVRTTADERKEQNRQAEERALREHRLRKSLGGQVFVSRVKYRPMERVQDG